MASDIEVLKQVVGGVRTVRNQKNISPREALALQVVGNNPLQTYGCVITKMANLSDLDNVRGKVGDYVRLIKAFPVYPVVSISLTLMLEKSRAFTLV